MTDPEVTAQNPPAAPAPSAPGTPSAPGVPVTPGAWPAPGVPVTPGVPATTQDPVTAPGPATVAPRGRRRWPVFLLAAVVVLGLAAGLVVWAPWTPPPVLRPAGLAAGPSTANSIAFSWSRPPTGPLPDKYLILSSGTVAGSVAGTATSYRQPGLTPATTYQYRVVAVRGGKRSPQSVLLTLSTLTPPISQARLQGSWQVYAKNILPAPGGRNGYISWQLSPVCATGPCDVMLHAKDGRYSFRMKLTRAGAAYMGQTVANLGPCGPRGNSIPDPTTLKIRIHVTKAVGENQVWAASSLAGVMVGTSKYVSTAAFYCSASTFKASLAGTRG